MIDSDVALEALKVLCHEGVIYNLGQGSGGGVPTADVCAGAAQLHQSIQELSIKDLTPIVLCGDTTSFYKNQTVGGILQGLPISLVNLPEDISEDKDTGQIILQPTDYPWSEEHLDPRFNYDFTKLKDTKTYYRGGEEYERPCGWQRFALKVLGKYDDNIWLGNLRRSTESVPGEWPVSYHGTNQKAVKAIIEEHLEAGPRKLYGRGIYSTPDINIAKGFATEFKSKKTGKKYKAILQNRINPEKRKICDEPKYWLVPIDVNASKEEEQDIVMNAIRPYGLLLQEV